MTKGRSSSLKEMAVPTFNYDGIDPDTKGKLICLAGEVHKGWGETIRACLAMGEAITGANELLATSGRNGRFKEWVERECRISKQTAYNYMWAWERFGNSKSLGLFTDEAMYLLAAPSAPAGAAEEAEKLASKGTRIALKQAKEILAKYKPKPATEPIVAIGHEETPSPSEEELRAAAEAVGEITPEERAAIESDSTAAVGAGDVSFVPAELEHGRTNGRERISPKHRKEVLAHFGKLKRGLDRLGVAETVRNELTTILNAIKEC